MPQNELYSKMVRKTMRRPPLLGLLWLLAFALFAYFDLHDPTLLILLLIFVLLAVFAIILLWYIARRIDKQRERALQADTRVLAAEQPVPNAQALSLPATIELRVSTKYFLLLSVAIIIGMVLTILAVPFFFPGIFSLLTPHPQGTHVLHIGLAGFIAIMLVAAIIALVAMFVAFRTTAKYVYHITEQGINTTYNKITIQLNWDQARLFTVNGTWKRGLPKTYALSNDETLVSWMWVPHRPFFLYQFRPTVPYDEYKRQMQGLLELVEAKTHLPLYDITMQRRLWV